MIKSKWLLLVSVVGALTIVGGILLHKSLNDSPPGAAQPLDHHQVEKVKTKLVRLLEEHDPKASLDYLRNAITEDTALARECHPLLHHLGRAAYEKYKDFNTAVGYQDGLCNSGYTHGVIEAHLIASNDIQATLKTTCSDQHNTPTFKQWQCYHGVGHGVMYFTNKDLPKSLSLCQSLSSDFARKSCSNGVFMERFIIVSHSGVPTSDTTGITMDLCKQQADMYKSVCYLYAPTAYLQRNINKYSGAFKDCERAEKKYIKACMYGVGGQAVKENITRPEVARDVCIKGPRKYIRTCIEGAVGLLINHHASPQPVKPLCDTAFARYKDICTAKITAWDKNYNSW